MKIIAGPCMAEDLHMMKDVAAEMKEGLAELGIEYYFKASYDKANRTSLSSPRGPGLTKGLDWLSKVKDDIGVKLLTDVHEPDQCWPVAEVADVLQIPAMLCRQTDLILAASDTGRPINIKKGQFYSAEAMKYSAAKAMRERDKQSVWLCERGTMFGYGDLVVDMRSLKTMHKTGHPVLMDITHCTQKPPSGTSTKSNAAREFAPMLARAAAATGYIDGFFMEVHPKPEKALSDGPCMLTPKQAIYLINILSIIHEQSQLWRFNDNGIISN